jgi:hypothetical protein
MLSCLDCYKNYVGQTDRSFHTRYKEHAQDCRIGNQKSNFAKHLLDHQHTLQLTEDRRMSVLHISSKGRMMNIIDRYHIYKETIHHNQIMIAICLAERHLQSSPKPHQHDMT